MDFVGFCVTRDTGNRCSGEDVGLWVGFVRRKSMISGSQIVQILKIEYFGDFYALGLNLRSADNRLHSALIATNNDGETISYNEFEEHLYPKTAVDGAEYSLISNSKDEMGIFLEKTVERCEFGVGKTLGTEERVLYYFRCIVAGSEFLFFNGGDIAACSIDKTDEILSQDIFLVEWGDHSPALAREEISWLVSVGIDVPEKM